MLTAQRLCTLPVFFVVGQGPYSKHYCEYGKGAHNNEKQKREAEPECFTQF
jgi:hypothetical protein